MSVMKVLLGQASRILAVCLLLWAIAPRYGRARAASTAAGVFIYAADDGGKVFASRDGGATWQGAQPANQADIGALAVSPLHPETAYLLARGYAGSRTATLYRTQDAGGHWQPLSGPDALARDGAASLAAGPGSLYLTTAGGVFASSDGQTWARLAAPVGRLIPDPQRAATLALAGASRISLSVDSGATWASVGPENTQIYDVAFSPRDADAAAAYTSRGVYRSSDGGRTWQHVQGSTAAPKQDASGAVQGLNPANPDELAVVTPQCGASASCGGASGYNTIYRSLDSGVRWSMLPGPGQGETALLAPTVPGTLLVGTDSGLYSYDLHAGARSGPVLGGSTIVALAAGVVPGSGGAAPTPAVPIPVAGQVLPSALPHGAIFAGLGHGYLYRSVDDGRSWQKAFSGMAFNANIDSLAATPSIVYAGTDSAGVYASTDNGATWHADNGGNASLATAMVTSLLVDPRDALRVYATGYKGLYRSGDGGMHWQLYADVRSGYDTLLVLDPGHPSTWLQIVPDHGVEISADGGRTWHHTTGLADAQAWDVAFDPRRPNRAFAAQRSGLYRSEDGGESWQLLRFGGIEARGGYSAVAVDPADSDRVVATAFAADGGARAYRSLDGGETWQTTGIPISGKAVAYSGSISMLRYDPSAPGTILAAESGTHRVDVSVDGGVTWRRSADFGEGEEVFALAISPRGPLPVDPVAPTATTEARYFGQTHHLVGGPLLAFFLAHGGVPMFGLPLTEAFSEGGALSQYFERARLVVSGEGVRVGALGVSLTAGRGFGPASPVAAGAAVRYFPRTRHALSGRFLAFWRQHHGELLLGEPISEPLYEANGDGSGRHYLVQYCEDARLEYHPELAGGPYEVSLGQLGRQYLHRIGWL